YGLPLRAEHGVRSVTEAVRSTRILCGEDSLWDGLNAEVGHDHRERNHQGKGNVLLVLPPSLAGEDAGPMQCRTRLDGLLHLRARGRMLIVTIRDSGPVSGRQRTIPLCGDGPRCLLRVR